MGFDQQCDLHLLEAQKLSELFSLLAAWSSFVVCIPSASEPQLFLAQIQRLFVRQAQHLHHTGDHRPQVCVCVCVCVFVGVSGLVLGEELLYLGHGFPRLSLSGEVHGEEAAIPASCSKLLFSLFIP